MTHHRPDADTAHLTDQEIAARIADVGLWPSTQNERKAPEAPAGETTAPIRVGGLSLQGWPVLRIWEGAVYVRIPQELQKPTGGCSCTYCKEHPKEVPSWDTLGIPIDGKRDSMTWTLHAPEWKPEGIVK